MKKGSIMFMVVMFVGLFIVIPLGFLLFSRKSEDKNVKGVATAGSNLDPSLITVNITSSGTWDLYKYLCETKEECLEGLDSGTFWGNVSGGPIVGYKVQLTPASKTKNYSYLKVYIRPGWGSTAGLFDINGIDEQLLGLTDKITHKGATYPILLIPVDTLSARLGGTVSFSD